MHKSKILFLGATQAHTRILSYLTQYDITFLPIAQRPRFNVKQKNLENILDQARSIIQNKKIKAVYSDSDLGSLLSSILCEEFQLPGPSLESTYTCYNKYYTRTVLDSPISFKSFHAYKDKPQTLTFPCFLKAPQSTFGVLGYTLNATQELEEKLPEIQKQIQYMNEPLYPIFQKYLSQKKYPLSLQPILLAEELIQLPQVTVEGYIYNKDIQVICIIDTNFVKKTRLFDNFSLPSRYPQHVQEQIVQQTIHDIKKSKLNNTFFNAEYWITDHPPLLIEINSRSATCFYHLYKNTINFDVYKSGIQLALGEKPRIKIENKTVGGQFNVITHKQGNTSDLMDYQYLEKQPYRYYKIHKPDTQTDQLSEHGNVLAQLEIFGQSYDDIKNKADTQRSKLLF